MRIPKYRRHSGRDSAFVEVGGKRRYLPGKYGSQESKDAYAEIIANLAREIPLPIKSGLTIDELCFAFLDHAKQYYDAKEYSAFKQVVCPIQTQFGHKPVTLFGPVSLRQVRNALVELGWCRQYVNRQINRVRRIFKWGVANELVDANVLTALKSLEPLRAGKSKAKEAPDVQPVDSQWVDATVEHAGKVMAAMIKLQRLTGMRSQSLVAMRPMDIDRSGEVWIYRPASHKGTWKGRDLSIFLGPKCQEILKPFLDRPAATACFSPKEASHSGARRNSQYRVDTYWQSVGYAIKAANKARAAAAADEGKDPPPEIPHWHPHQLRHTRATEIRVKYGLDGAQVSLGHSSADVTQIYAERDFDLARTIASETA